MRSNVYIHALRLRIQGISLVDLVVVISLVGILIAFAIPRFTHLGNDVRASEVVALSVNLRRAAEVAHAQYLRSGSTLSSATLEGRTIQLMNGYPDVGPQGIRLAIADLSDFTANSTPTSVTLSKSGAPAAAQCAVTYHASPTASSTSTITDLDTTGC